MKFWCLLCFLSINAFTEGSKVKKDILSYSEADLERLYQEWEENDGESIDNSEQSEYHKKPMNVEEMKAKANNPEDLLKMTKKGQTLMMFVEVRDPENPSRKDRPFTEKWTSLWQSMLYNNHVDAQVFVIDDDRAIFMFKEGAQAFEAKNFLLKQNQVTEVTLEGQQFPGAGATMKKEL